MLLVTDTGSFVGRTESWSYAPMGRIDAVDPAVGQIGTVTTITGLSLRGSGANVSTISLGGVVATVLSESDSSVVVVSPRGVGLAVDVVVTSTSGATVTLVLSLIHI